MCIYVYVCEYGFVHIYECIYVSIHTYVYYFIKVSSVEREKQTDKEI